MNSATLIRTLIIYAICVPLAVFLGYELTSPLARSTYYVLGLLVLALTFPVLLRWHHFLLFATWNLAAVLFFIHGQPPIWMLMVAISLGVSILQRTTDKTKRFSFEPHLVLPLIGLAVVILATAHYTGGIGIRALGSEVYGGKRYVILLASVLGYFALTAQRIPPERAGLFVAAFFLPGITKAIGDLFLIVPPSLQGIFWVFPPNVGSIRGNVFELGTTRLGGISGAATMAFFFLMAQYGVRSGILSARLWRPALILALLPICLLGGFRSVVFTLILVFVIQFFLEGLHRTKWLPVMILSGLFLAVVTAVITPRLPFTFQRALAFLPLKVDPAARLDAQYSTEWRIQMWKAVLPEVPEHFWLGKGYALNPLAYDLMQTRSENLRFAENWDATIAGNYHNGPLSVILTFGIWGVMAFFWFLFAVNRALYLNFRYGPSEFRMYNTFLLALCITKTVYFFLIYGSIEKDLFDFVGLVGLSISLNGGVCRRAQVALSEKEELETRPMIPVRMRPFPG